MDYKLDMFRQMLLYMRRGKSNGVHVNAKPIFCLALIVWAKINNENEIKWGDELLCSLYRSIFKEMNIIHETPIWKPFYYLSSEPFYSLIWEKPMVDNVGTIISPKFLRENLLYAKLDDDLWELLQNSDNREYLKNAIINHYLKTDD